MLAIEKNHEHGIYWYDADENISLFEDLEHGCYAWRGMNGMNGEKSEKATRSLWLGHDALGQFLAVVEWAFWS